MRTLDKATLDKWQKALHAEREAYGAHLEAESALRRVELDLLEFPVSVIFKDAMKPELVREPAPV